MKRISYNLVIIPLFVILSGCGKSTFDKEETRVEIEKFLPFYIKIESFAYDTSKAIKKGEEKETDSRWSVKVPISVKYKFTEPTYDIINIEPDYRKNGKEKVYFIKPRYKEGEILERSGMLEKDFAKKIQLTEGGYKAFTEEQLSFDIKDAPHFHFDDAKTLADYKPRITIKETPKSAMGKIFDLMDNQVPFGVPESKIPANVLKEDAIQTYKNDQQNLVKNFPKLIQGQWEDKNVTIYYGETNEYIIYFKNKKYFKERKWAIGKDGLFEFWEIYDRNQSGFERLININDKSCYMQDVERTHSFASPTAQLRYKDSITEYKKVKSLKELAANDSQIRKTLSGVWVQDDGDLIKLTGDGIYTCKNKNSTAFEKGKWLVKNSFVKLIITEDQHGTKDWQRWFFIEKLDKKNFVLRRVLGGYRDQEFVWKCSFLRSIEDDLKQTKANEELIKTKIIGVFTEDLDASSGAFLKKGIYRDEKYSHFHGRRFWKSYTEFKEKGTFEQKFYERSQSNGSLIHHYTYKGDWDVNGDEITLIITQKNNNSVNEKYRYSIEFDEKGNAKVNAIGDRGYIFYKLYRSETKADGTMSSLTASSSQKLSQGEQNTIKLINALFEDINSAKKEYEDVKKLGNSIEASKKAVEMKKNTIPNIEAKITAIRKLLVENRSNIEPNSFNKYNKVLNASYEYIVSLKNVLSKYSTLEENVDNLKGIGSKLLNLF